MNSATPNNNGPISAVPDENTLLPLIADARAEQQRAIRTRKRLVVVSAGAGTGKTHTLARRFAWLLAADPTCRVEQILTLTFTQLAAAEMRERIKLTLTRWRDAYGDKLPHLADALERIDEAYISTIHSFALRVVRESGLSLDVDPGASMVSEPEEREFWADLAWSFETLDTDRLCLGLDDAWRARARELLGDPLFMDICNHYGASALANLAKDAGALHGSKNARPEDLWEGDPAAAESVREALTSRLLPEWRAVRSLWQEVIFPDIRRNLYEGKDNNFTVKIRELYEKWRDAEHTPDTDRDFYVDLIGGALRSLPGNAKLKKTIEEIIGRKLTEWRDSHLERAAVSESIASCPGFSEEESRVRALLLRAAALGWACWEQARGRAGTLSFDDLIRFAGDTLASDPSYAGKFRHIMIDEFQDTDGLQENLASSMTRAWGEDAENRSLFVVGDIKQSIYRFRHANPKLFAEYIRRGESGAEGGEHIPLSCSYRMSGRMMDDVNALFANVWRDGVIGGTDAPTLAYEPLASPSDAPWWSARNEYSDTPALEILLAEEENESEKESGKEKEKITKTDKRLALAAALAEKLTGMISNKTPIWDKSLPGDSKFRPMKWSDIAILAPTRTQYPILEEVFSEEGIPALFGGGVEYFNRGEVRDLVNLLRLLDRPEDDYAMTAWMASPFSGLPPEAGIDLLSRARSERKDLRALLAEEYPESMARLASMRRKARVAGPSRALLLLQENLGWLGAYVPEARAKVLANVRRGGEITREYEDAFGRGLSACADYLGRAMRESARVEEADPAAAGIDALRVMTVHASKGLEFPVVVLLGMEDSVKRVKNTDSARASGMFGAVAHRMPILPPDAVAENEEFESATERWDSFIESLEQEEEKERLLYVALTRAQERLICCGVASGKPVPADGGDSWLDWLLAANDEAGGRFPVTSVIIHSGGRAEAGRRRSAPRGARERGEPAGMSAPAARIAVYLEKFSASAYSLFRWCPHAYRMRYRQGREMVWEMPEGDGYGGADMGTLAHWVLSRWDLKRATLARHLRVDLNRAELEEYMRSLPAYLRPVCASEGVRKTLYGWLSAFAATEACAELREAADAGRLRTEWSFRVPHNGVKLVGGIDVLWEDEAGLHIRDWKITPEKTAPEEMYRNQVEFYAFACHLVKPDVPANVGLLYLRPQGTGQGSVVWDGLDWPELARGVGEAASAAASGPFPRAAHRCGVCPFASFCRSEG